MRKGKSEWRREAEKEERSEAETEREREKGSGESRDRRKEAGRNGKMTGAKKETTVMR